MIKRNPIRSIRFRVLSVLFATGAIGIIGSFIVANRVEQASDARSLRVTVRALSKSVFELALENQPRTVFVALAHSSPSFYFLIFRDKVIVYDSYLPEPRTAGRILDIRENTSVSVTVIAPQPNSTALSAELTAVSAIVIVGVLLGAVWVTHIISDAVGSSVEKASKVAASIERGDLSTRLTSALPPEFESLAAAFDNMASRLEFSDIEQRRFLSDLAHEIATPINSVTGLAIALTDNTIETETDKIEVAAIIKSETERILHLLQDLRSLDTLELTNAATLTHFDAYDLCYSAYQRFLPSTKDGHIILTFASDSTILYQDRRLIEMVVDNFLTNAIRYVNAHDSISITGLDQGEGQFMITVKDTGIGIEQKHLEKIFDRLYRVNEARDRVSGGSGLGLSIARRAALSIGGHITVKSKYGFGSTFALVIPITHERSRNQGRTKLQQNLIPPDIAGLN